MASPSTAHQEPHIGPAGNDPSQISVPEPAIKAVGILLAAIVMLVAVSQWTGIGQPNGLTVEADQRFALVFSDGDAGAIDVSHAESGDLVHRFEGEETGFIRVALKALIFDRKRAGVGQDAPFHMLIADTGRAYLLDPSTGEFVALGAFGAGNGAQFNPLIEAAQRAGIALPAATITLKGEPA